MPLNFLVIYNISQIQIRKGENQLKYILKLKPVSTVLFLLQQDTSINGLHQAEVAQQVALLVYQ